MRYLLVNFGGPRNLEEVPSFLRELLCDRDVIRTPLPSFLHRPFFSYIAKKRAKKVIEDYREIGGGSPIYFDTEAIASLLEALLKTEVFCFHRYLKETHPPILEQLERGEEEWIALPLFPQFCYATTGSSARFLEPYVRKGKLRWISSYAHHPSFIEAFQKKIRLFLKEQNLEEEKTVLLFSAHGVPKQFIEEGDPYEKECRLSFEQISSAFPKALRQLSFQSKFGKGEWLSPSTEEMCQNILSWRTHQEHIVLVPLSFTSDHIETLFEIEKLYLPILQKQGMKAYRCPALNREPYWIEALADIAKSSPFSWNRDLIRPSFRKNP